MPVDNTSQIFEIFQLSHQNSGQMMSSFLRHGLTRADFYYNVNAFLKYLLSSTMEKSYTLATFISVYNLYICSVAVRSLISDLSTLRNNRVIILHKIA